MPLYVITGPDDLPPVTILAPTPMMALRAFHAEGFGGDRQVRLIDGALVFRRVEDQLLVVGEWRVTPQSMNGAGTSITTVVHIPPPPDADPG